MMAAECDGDGGEGGGSDGGGGAAVWVVACVLTRRRLYASARDSQGVKLEERARVTSPGHCADVHGGVHTRVE